MLYFILSSPEVLVSGTTTPNFEEQETEAQGTEKGTFPRSHRQDAEKLAFLC